MPGNKMLFQDMDQNRKRLINSLKKKGIRDNNVLRVMSKLKREDFISENLRPRSYEDNALPFMCEQTISQPYTIAFMTGMLGLKPEDKTLEIGTGSGYQAAILSKLCSEVYSIERIEDIFHHTSRLFEKLEIKVHTKLSDGTRGWPEESPFDKIIVTASAPSIPPPLKKQLKIGGKLVIPIGNRVRQIMTLIERTGENDYKIKEKDAFRFVPLIGQHGWDEDDI